MYNLIGKKFGKLTVIKKDTTQVKRNGESIFWICKCDCGKTTSVRSKSLRRGETKSCGCLHGENHGLRHTKEYNSWAGMKQRCLNPNNEKYPIYGGRGITVCKEWINSFQQFYNDMGSRPSNNHSIDRINNDGNYEPSNCRWSNNTLQSRNRGYNKIKNKKQANKIRYLYASGSYTYQDLADEFKCSKSSIARIINNKTWK